MSACLIHASCVEWNGKGILLLGESGSGKSDLALRMIDTGAMLVADDQVNITIRKKYLIASPAESLKGKIEIRGMGIVDMDYIPETELKVAITLVSRDSVERLPEKAWFTKEDVRIPLISLHAFDASTTAKIRQFFAHSVVPSQMSKYMSSVDL